MRWAATALSRRMRCLTKVVIARGAAMATFVYCIISLICGFVLFAMPVAAFPVHGSQTVLPVGTELNEDALDRPREVFRSEGLGGRKSYLVNLGDVAFSSLETSVASHGRPALVAAPVTSMAQPTPSSTFPGSPPGTVISIRRAASSIRKRMTAFSIH